MKQKSGHSVIFLLLSYVLIVYVLLVQESFSEENNAQDFVNAALDFRGRATRNYNAALDRYATKEGEAGFIAFNELALCGGVGATLHHYSHY